MVTNSPVHHKLPSLRNNKVCAIRTMDGVHSQGTPARPTQLLPQSGESKGAAGKHQKTSARSHDKSAATLGKRTSLDRVSGRPKGLVRGKKFENHPSYYQTESAKIWSFSNNRQTQSSSLSVGAASNMEDTQCVPRGITAPVPRNTRAW